MHELISLKLIYLSEEDKNKCCKQLISPPTSISLIVKFESFF